MVILDICKTPVITISEDATLQQAALLMQAKQVGCLVATDAHNVPLGIITDRDIAVRGVVRSTSSDCQAVKSIMSDAPKTILPDGEISEAVALMRKFRIRRVLVVEADTGKLLGLVSADDILLETLTLLDRIGEVYFLQDKVGKSHFNSDFTQM